MEIINEQIGIKLAFEKAYENQDDNDADTFYKVTATSTISDCHSEDCYSRTVRKHQIGNIISDFLFAKTLEDASRELIEINEVAVVDYICNRPQIIENIAITLSFSLTEDEKVMVMYGEANSQYKTELEYGDIIRDLHKYSRRISYDKIVKMSDYEVTRYFTLSFLDTLQTCSLDCQRENPFGEELDEMKEKLKTQ